MAISLALEFVDRTLHENHENSLVPHENKAIKSIMSFG